MTYQLTFRQKPSFFHAVVTGINSKENVERYLDEVRAECQRSGCVRVLIEERLEGPRLGLMDVFDIVSRGSLRAMNVIQDIAYVDVNAEGDLMRFAETVAVNRALNVTVFPTVAEAEAWISNPESPRPIRS